jgi:hypothetical protein
MRTHRICIKNPDEFQIQADEKISFDMIHHHYGQHFIPTSGWIGHIERE